VVLLHGLRLNPFGEKAAKPVLHGWQETDSIIVRVLQKYADVYAFAYGQNTIVDQIARAPGLRQNIQRLKKIGYSEIILIGYSAGGVIARNFVEDYPAAGITKVIQVCAPNAGSPWARDQLGINKSQEFFLASLTNEGRMVSTANRADKRIPEDVQFVCVVGNGEIFGDGIVSCRSQWPEDLQKQGIPAYALPATHFFAMRTKRSASKLATLIQSEQPRWRPDQVAAAKQQILREKKKRP
jgi:pimeloyl-ACP methyl ester carboxylesterase